MRESHREQVERWAHFVRENPTKWQEPHNQFINALFDMHQLFRERLFKISGGKEKYIKLRRIKNVEGYDWLKD